MGFVEKGLLSIKGKAFLDHVYHTVKEVTDEVVVAVSPYTPKTRSYCLRQGYAIMDTPGLGFSLDLRFIFRQLKKSMLVVPVDLPLITPDALFEFLDRALRYDASVVTLRLSDECKRIYGYEYVGVGLLRSLRGDWADVVLCRYPDFLNVNTPEDLERLLSIFPSFNIPVKSPTRIRP